MVIKHKQVNGKGMFYVELDGAIQAEMIYTKPAANKMIIEHTEVSDELKGQNTGFELVRTAVDYARMHGITIIPVCPFTKSVFDKKPDFQDVLDQ